MLMKENLMYVEKENIKIIKNGGKYGLMSDSEVVLPTEYDKIFLYGRYLYVLHKGSKIGAIRFEDEDLSYRTVAETKYYTLDFYWHDLLFSNGDEFVYYFCDAGKYGFESTRTFTNISVESRTNVIYAEDDKNLYIFTRQSGEILWSEKKEQNFKCGKPCYSYYDKSCSGKLIFYDLVNNTYIVPSESGYIML